MIVIVTKILKLVTDGQEKHIRMLLEKKSKEFFPEPLPGLGPRAKIVKTLNKITPLTQNYWKPSNILMAQFSEHTKAVNQLVMSPDHSYFSSCSKDGTGFVTIPNFLVKIWDTRRLHINVTNRSRLTYMGHGLVYIIIGSNNVRCITFCEGKHSIASASDDGKIHIGRIEYIKRSDGGAKYDGYTTFRKILLENDCATCLNHYDTENESLLVFGTSKGKLVALDLRSMKVAWSYKSPSNYGRITSLFIDHKKNWAMTGTHRGVLSLWDVRFKLPLVSFELTTNIGCLVPSFEFKN